MKRNSLCVRLTVMTGAILLLCSVALTLSASYNAGKQFTVVASSNAALANHTGTVQDSVIFEGDPSAPLSVSEGSAVTTAKRNFNIVGLVTLVAISILGTGGVYFAARRTLRPIQELSEQMTAITENNLDVRVDVGQRTDEVGALCHAFNVMLERLNNSFAAQKQFSANVAHELKTPLATMQASVQVLRLDEVPTSEDCLNMLDTVERNTARLRAVIDDLLRLCDEQTEFETREIVLYDLFSGIFKELAPQLEAKHIQAEIDCEQAPIVIGNEGLLYRAFFNLAENAVKYGQEGGKIQVTSTCDGSMGTIRISDTGIGIPAEHLSRIFEPFYRVNQSRSRKLGGAGLGLSVVKTIVERHGWNISVDSTAGTGTEFQIKLYQT